MRIKLAQKRMARALVHLALLGPNVYIRVAGLQSRLGLLQVVKAAEKCQVVAALLHVLCGHYIDQRIQRQQAVIAPGGQAVDADG